MTEASVCYNSTLVNTVSNICWKKATVTLVSKNGLHSELPLSQGCLPSVLWHCWLGSRKGIRHVKKLSSGVLAWLSVCSEMHMAQRIPLPLTVLCFSKIQTGFTFLVLAHPGSSGQRAVKRVCVCVCYLYLRVLFFATSIKTILECWDEFCLTIKIRLSTLQLLQPESKNSTAECRSLTA